MLVELTPRQREILRAIVEDFFVHVRPVASHPLKKGHRMEFSAPTIRNEMLKLEELGYVAKRHTSSGRVPTEKAYRLYVEDLLSKAPETYGPEMRRLIAQWSTLAAELQTFVVESLQMLSAQVETAAFASLPFVDSDQIEGLDMLPLGMGRIQLAIRLLSGWVEARVMLLPPGAPEFDWEEISRLLSERLAGLRVHQVTPRLLQKVLQEIQERVLLRMVLESFFHSLRREARVFLDGWQYLSDKPEFREHPSQARKLVEVLHSHEVLLKVVEHARPEDANPGIVWESELRPFGVEGCVIVLQGYRSGRMAGMVGVAGPMRLDYPRVLALLHDYTAALAYRFSPSGPAPAGDAV